MNLSGLFPILQDSPPYRSLVRTLKGGKGRQKVVILDAAKPFLLACIYRDLGLPILVITHSSEVAKRLHDELSIWCHPKASSKLFPEIDILPHERLTPDPATTYQRLQVLSSLFEHGKEPRDFASPPLIIASAHAAIQKTVAASDFASSCRVIKKGTRIDLDELLAHWMALGYERREVVEIPGTMSRRGGIIDVYSPNNDLPARIELVGDEVESIRWFNPLNQLSVEFNSSITIVPAREMPISREEGSEGTIKKLNLSNCSAEARDRIEDEIKFLLNGQWNEGLEFYAPLFNKGILLDYLPQNSLIVLDDPENIKDEISKIEIHAEGLRESQVKRGEIPLNFPRPYFAWSELKEKVEGIGRYLSLEKWRDESSCLVMSFGIPSNYGGRLSIFLKEAEARLREQSRIIVVSQQATRLAEILREQDIIVAPSQAIEQLPPGSIKLIQGSLSGGWTLDGLMLFSDTEIFGFSKKRRPMVKRRVEHEIFLSDLRVGDWVVHIDHGIARFSGMIRMAPEGIEREYLVLEYADNDRLYLPSDQVDRIARYIGPGGYSPSLSRLSTQEWIRTKQRVKQAASELAQELLDLYASRELLPGFAFSPDSLWQNELEASFPYVETPDQLETIQEVKSDMEKPKPMDRLVCGDVGYGKTEVALRAAFKAVMDGMQVAVLIPTTVLAQQHFTTFTERLGAFPVKVEMLSRFRSPKEQQAILDGLRSGAIDICIGTHRLLQKDVAFRNLGLVIIDEEQKFGVAHKERLKQLRKEVDVLTMSATPIPRTLHMSLIEVRDSSTMETPPEERLPIKTYVAEYNENLIREAILRELDRNGQVFFVHNRVQSIVFVAERLRKLVPEARIAIAHGQMPEEMLESVMLDFIGGKIDVLVCTIIVESGLDLPNVNTLIVNQSDKLGLTQLYHLRGRVGRGAVRAYAYFLYDRGKRLTEPAQERLKTIFEATEIGAGFRIAMKDLEIRGAGNILGPEQSGHIGAVGFDLYCRLLAEAVEELKAEREQRVPSLPSVPRYNPPTIDLPLPACIPEEYVADLNSRLEIYQRLAKLNSPEQVEDISRELEDRFGKIPFEVKNLLYIVKVKALGSKAGAQAISTEGKQIVVKVRDGVRLDKVALQDKLRDKLKLKASRVRLDIRQLGEEWPRMLEELVREMAKAS